MIYLAVDRRLIIDAKSNTMQSPNLINVLVSGRREVINRYLVGVSLTSIKTLANRAAVLSIPYRECKLTASSDADHKVSS